MYANRQGVKHGKGDFIIASDAGNKPNLSDIWVVNGEIFPKTYDLRSFSGMFNANTCSAETVQPKQNFVGKSKVADVNDIKPYYECSTRSSYFGQVGISHLIDETYNILLKTPNKSFSLDNKVDVFRGLSKHEESGYGCVPLTNSNYSTDPISDKSLKIDDESKFIR